MDEREAVRGRADGLEPVQLRGQQVGGALESAHHGGTGGRHGRPLVGAPAAHVHARTVLGGGHHTGGRGGDRAVVVEDRQQQRLQQRALAERALHLQHRRIREEHLALAIALDRSGEVETLQPRDGFGAHDVAVGEEAQILVVQVETLERVKDAAGAGHHPIPASLGQMPGEDLEDAFAVGGAVLERGVQHRVFIHVGHHGRRIITIVAPPSVRNITQKRSESGRRPRNPRIGGRAGAVGASVGVRDGERVGAAPASGAMPQVLGWVAWLKSRIC